MATTRSHLCQAFTRSRSTPDCVLTLPTVGNGNIPAKAISHKFTVRARASLSSSAAVLEADSIHHTTRRRKTRKSSKKMKFSVETAIRGKQNQLKTSSATVTTSRQLRFRPCLAYQHCSLLISCSTRRSTQMTVLAQSTPFNGTPLDTTRRSGLNGRTWNVKDEAGHNLTRSLELLAALYLL